MGDSRVYGYLIILRAVTSLDFMSAEPFEFPSFDLLKAISRRIVNEVDGVSRVLYGMNSRQIMVIIITYHHRPPLIPRHPLFNSIPSTNYLLKLANPVPDTTAKPPGEITPKFHSIVEKAPLHVSKDTD